MPEKSSNLDKLVALIEARIAEDPHEYEGHVWCAIPQPELAASLGVSVETLRRRISKAPFVREHTHKGGKPVTLVRVGEAGPKTKKQVQRHLANIWRKMTGKAIIGRPFGHLGGMVDAWGLEKAPEILILVLKNWPAFMAGTHIEIDQLEVGYKRFYKYPSTKVILRFKSVGVEMYLMDQQEKHGLNADYGGLSYPK